MAAVVVGGEHIAAPAYERVGLRQRPDAMAITVEAVAGAGRLCIRSRHGRRANDDARASANQSRQRKPPSQGKTQGSRTQRTVVL